MKQKRLAKRPPSRIHAKRSRRASVRLGRTSPQHRAIKASIKRRRPVHHRLVLHPVTIFFLLMAAVVLVGLTYHSFADTITVSATVEAPPLSQAAYITYPTDNSQLADPQLDVQGTCPLNSYVKLYDNGNFSGVAVCSNDGTFTISMQLTVGENLLHPQVYNLTDVPGPQSPDVTVNYAPPRSPGLPPSPPPSTPTSQSGSSSGSSGGGAPAPLVIQTDFTYKAFVLGASYTTQIVLKGGKTPYRVSIDWGDHSPIEQQLQTSDSFTIHHRYATSGNFVIKLHILDANNRSADMQLIGLIRSSSAPGVASSITKPSTSGLQLIGPKFHSFLLIAWPTLVIISLMAITFWLGERKEYETIVTKQAAKKRRRK